MVKRSNSAAYKGSKIRLMDKILHDPKDPKLWELWYIPYYGSCRILSIVGILMPRPFETGCCLMKDPGPFPRFCRDTQCNYRGINN